MTIVWKKHRELGSSLSHVNTLINFLFLSSIQTPFFSHHFLCLLIACFFSFLFFFKVNGCPGVGDGQGSLAAAVHGVA